MSYDTATIRELVEAALDNNALNALCFDHFRAVYDRFADAQARGLASPSLVDNTDWVVLRPSAGQYFR
jgi:hypothetical protein